MRNADRLFLPFHANGPQRLAAGTSIPTQVIVVGIWPPILLVRGHLGAVLAAVAWPASHLILCIDHNIVLLPGDSLLCCTLEIKVSRLARFAGLKIAGYWRGRGSLSVVAVARLFAILMR